MHVELFHVQRPKDKQKTQKAHFPLQNQIVRYDPVGTKPDSLLS